MRTALLLCFTILLFFKVSAQIPTYKPTYVLGNSLNNPYDIIVGDDGLLYVSDSYTTRLFDTSGKFKNELHLFGRYNDFNSHIAIGRDKQGNSYILTAFDAVIHKVNPAGEVSLLFGGKGTLPGEFNNPKGIAVSPEGNIYIADTHNHRIQKFDKNGDFLLSFGSFGAETGQFNMPTQLALDKDGNLYVADSDNNRIQVFNSGGSFIKQIGATANSSQPFFFPSDVTVDSDGNVYVADIAQYNILIFDSAGNLIRSFGSKGNGDGQFISSNVSIAVDAEGFIYVAEGFSPCRVQKFTPEGSYILSFGETGTQGKLLDYPVAAVSDAIGNIFVANSISGLVKRFDRKGNHLFSFGGRADAAGQFRGFISDMKMDKHGYLYVLSSDVKGSIQKFNARGELIARFAPSSSTGKSEPNAPASPFYLAIDPEGFLYISDKTYLYKYNLSGTFINRITLVNNETGNFIDFTDNPINSAVPFNIDNNGNIYVSLIKKIKIYNSKGNFVRDFAPQGQPHSSYVTSLDFDAQNNMYTTEQGYMKKFNPETGNMLAISSYHSFLINYLRSKISVNASGSNVYITGFQKTVACFSNGNEQDSETSKYISGTIYHDKNENCVQYEGENGIAGILVETNPGLYYGYTDSKGNYSIEVDSGTYTISQILPEKTGSKITELCIPDGQKEFTTLDSNTKGPNFGNRVTLSPHLAVSVSSTRRRRCFESTTKVRYSNSGFATAPDAKVYLQLPKEVELLSADKPYTLLPDGTYEFTVGDLGGRPERRDNDRGQGDLRRRERARPHRLHPRLDHALQQQASKTGGDRHRHGPVQLRSGHGALRRPKHRHGRYGDRRAVPQIH